MLFSSVEDIIQHYKKNGGEKMLKAYQVYNDDEGCIVFAESAGKAKSKAPLWNNEFIYLRAKRAKWADKFIGQKVPKEEYLRNGWRYECDCYVMQDEESAIIIDDVVYCEKCKPPKAQKETA